MRSLFRRIPCALAAVLLLTGAATAQSLEYEGDYSQGKLSWGKFKHVFLETEVPVANLQNSPRLDELLRDGELYLSLADAIALAIENNLDIEVARYGPRIADTDILRAKAGAQLRGVQTQIGSLSTGTSAAGGAGGRGGDLSGIEGRAGGGGAGGAAVGDASTFFGSAIPNLDYTLQGSLDYAHSSNPQSNAIVAGQNVFVTDASNSFIGLSKGLLTGTRVSLNWANRFAETNSPNQILNPSLRSNLSLQIRQSLLQGFGKSVNSRNILVARNNRTVSDLAFKAQLITTIAQVQRLYWDLVSFRSDVDSRREDLRLSEKLLDDNQKRVEIGTLAPIEIVRAEAEVAARQQDLTLAETRVQQQEEILKNALSKNGLGSPSLMEARIRPTDQIQIPDSEQVRPVQDLMQEALQRRPEMEQARLRLENRDIQVKGVKNALRPTLDIVADVTNNGLAGRENALAGGRFTPDPFFIGNLLSTTGQIFRRNFPDYSIGVQFRMPLNNRQAQADMTATMLERRQADLQMRQQENSIQLGVKNALIALTQARAQYNASVKARELQEQTLEAEQKKFDLGASTIFLVVQAQRDLALSRSNEIAAQNTYVKAKLSLDEAVGRTLEVNDIVLEQAFAGRVGR